MEIYDNADSSYKAAGAETYHLPVLYTEDERSSYAAWGIKKEKLLLPFDWLLDKIMHRPEEPKMLQVTPKETGVSYFLLRGTTVLAQGMLTWDAWEAALTVETNEILLEGQRLRIGSNTIASIYPPEKQKPWMDHPAEQITGTISLAYIRENMQGYRASLEEQKREAEWRRQNP
jgi:hypothetical protein